jgi:hypothetical protein
VSRLCAAGSVSWVSYSATLQLSTEHDGFILHAAWKQVRTKRNNCRIASWITILYLRSSFVKLTDLGHGGMRLRSVSRNFRDRVTRTSTPHSPVSSSPASSHVSFDTVAILVMRAGLFSFCGVVWTQLQRFRIESQSFKHQRSSDNLRAFPVLGNNIFTSGF